MSHFGFENDIHSVLKLDMPITNAPMARWQRKASTSNSTNPNTLSPNKSANRSLSSSKTPSKTPGKNGKTQSTPSKAGADRFIPVRNSKQMDVASFLLSKENEPAEDSTSAVSSTQKAWSVTLNGCDLEEAKILHLGGKPLNAPEGYQNNLKVLYSQTPTPASMKKTRYISTHPERILDAPELRNDFYLNLMDWGRQNYLAVALAEHVYLWDASQGDIVLLKKMEEENGYICSVSWSRDGNFLAVGTSDCKVELWDVQYQKRLRSMDGHRARVGCLSWNDHILSRLNYLLFFSELRAPPVILVPSGCTSEFRLLVFNKIDICPLPRTIITLWEHVSTEIHVKNTTASENGGATESCDVM
uniref:Cell division cycle 20 homolog n=1 Tax=Astyanax mexicanus TaxID=7994 RepID=A0A8B9LNC5_ASTMX